MRSPLLAECILDLHCDARKLMNKLCAYALVTPEFAAQIEEVRRWLVLACVLVKKVVRAEKSFYDFTVKDLVTNADVPLSQYEGQVSLVVNVASA